MQTIESEIISRFGGFLDREEFTVLRLVIDPEHFGNEVVICSSPGFRLKLVKDRGEFLFELSPEAGKPWYPLEDVLKVALGSKRFKDYHPFFAEDPIGTLALYIPQVTQAIHAEEKEIATLGQKRGQDLANDIFRSPKA